MMKLKYIIYVLAATILFAIPTFALTSPYDQLEPDAWYDDEIDEAIAESYDTESEPVVDFGSEEEQGGALTNVRHSLQKFYNNHKLLSFFICLLIGFVSQFIIKSAKGHKRYKIGTMVNHHLVPILVTAIGLFAVLYLFAFGISRSITSLVELILGIIGAVLIGGFLIWGFKGGFETRGGGRKKKKEEDSARITCRECRFYHEVLGCRKSGGPIIRFGDCLSGER